MKYITYTPGIKLLSIYLFTILIQVTEKAVNFYHIFSLFIKLKIHMEITKFNSNLTFQVILNI